MSRIRPEKNLGGARRRSPRSGSAPATPPERAGCAALPAAGLPCPATGSRAPRATHHHRALAFHEHVHRIARLHPVDAALVGAVADEDLSSQAEGLDTRGKVHLVPDHRVLRVEVRAQEHGHHAPAVDADAEVELGPAFLAVVAVQVLHCNLHVDGASHGAVHGILAGVGSRLEDHEDRVAHELVDGAVVLEDDLAHANEAAVEQLEHDHRR